MKNTRFCYRVDKSAGLAVDENGNNAEAYISVKVGINTYELESDGYKDMQDAWRKIIVDRR